MANHSCILALRNPWTVQKGKIIWHRKISPSGCKVFNMLPEKSGQLLIAPEKIEGTGPKQKWHSIVDVSHDKSKIPCCKEQYCLGAWNVRSISESCSDVSDSLRPNGLCSPWNSPGQNTGVASLSLLQGIFPIQKSNPGLPHCRWILYQLNHQGSPRVLEWVAYPFSSGYS